MPTSTTRMIQWRVNRHTRWGGSNFPTVKEVAERATSESDLTAEGKKRRWLINGSAREEGPMGRLPRLGSPGPSTGDVKTRLAASSSFQRGPVSVLRAPLHSWPRISRRSTENPPYCRAVLSRQSWPRNAISMGFFWGPVPKPPLYRLANPPLREPGLALCPPPCRTPI